MLPGDAIQQYLTGAWRLMMGKPDGVRLLDISADGFWSSFFAIVVAMPALAVGWVGMANALGGETFAVRTGLMARFLVADLVAWVLPLLLLGAVAGMAGISKRYVAYVVASNWGSAIVIWIMLPPTLIELFWPGTGEALAIVWLMLFLGTLVLWWRLTNAVLRMGALIASAVFTGMFVLSLATVLTLQSLLGIVPSA